MKLNKAILFISLFVFVSLWACKQEEAQNSEPEYIPAELPEDFMPFYDKFHADSIFQMEHIVFPLPGKPASGQFSVEVTTAKWLKDGWVLHKSFDENDDTFERQFVVFSDDIIIEHIFSPDYGYRMERRFARTKDSWNLIYYADIQKPE